MPFLKSHYSAKEFAEIEKNIVNIRKQFDELYASGKFISYIKDTKTQKRFEL